MSRSNAWTFDTDMLLHRRSHDRAVEAAAAKLWESKKKRALASFSKLEVKRILRDHVLLHNKVVRSESLRDVMARVSSVGGRRAQRMLASIILFLDKLVVLTGDWEKEVKPRLLTYLDGSISLIWSSLESDFDELLDRTKCTRAREDPVRRDRGWDLVIPRCHASNTTCSIQGFLESHKTRLVRLCDDLGPSPPTDELLSITKAVAPVAGGGSFVWQGTACQGVGDLLIGLEAKASKGLVTSNHREHSHLSKSLGYVADVFDVAKFRMK